MTLESPNRWWQNWPKTHAYVAEKMFFPTSPQEIAGAIRKAEADRRPLRAVGGGWSFSDAALPGTVATNRPRVYAVEALTEAVPLALSFPTDRSQPSVASVAAGPPMADARDSMIMVDDSGTPAAIDSEWTYLGGGSWLWSKTGWTYNDDALVLRLAGSFRRPVRNLMGLPLKDADTAGTLVMWDLAPSPARPLRDWFYNGQGVWSVGVAGDSPPDQGNLFHLERMNRLLPPGVNLSPRAANPADSLALLLSRQQAVPPGPEPVYLINTRSLASSLQQRLPDILSDRARDATSEQPSSGNRREFLFHVEAGITIAELGQLLAHQSPRLSLQAISGSPGATLAGALSTGTHGAEFNWPLLIDMVKALHLVGPGGHQWWIEGDESVADPEKLRAAYPDIAWQRIISGTTGVNRIASQDWLNAAIVSMGCMGVLYSLVLKVVPQFGVREVVVQKTWGRTAALVGSPPERLFVGSQFKDQDLAMLLGGDQSTPQARATSQDVSRRVVKLMQAGNLSGTGIPQADALGNTINQYADLAINPNRRPDGDWDCWVGNREVTQQVPLDPQPPTANETTGMIDGITMAFESEDLKNKLKNMYGFGSILDLLNGQNVQRVKAMVDRITQAKDFIDVALDSILTPMVGGQNGAELAQALLSGILSGLLGTANTARRSDKTGVSVGALGFPESGVMGTGIEIALAPTDAFGFVQREILDKVSKDNPFFGYVSIRLCSQTETLMGMQQFGDPGNPCSVMVEVVAYGTDGCRNFIQELQRRTLELIQAGSLDAMLHWGLENDQLRGSHLRSTRALQRRTRSGMTRLDTFKAVRSRLHAAAPGAYRVFDNSFTERLGLSMRTPDVSYLTPLLLDEPATDISYLVPLLLSG